MIEFIGVLLAWVCKWYKSSKYKRSRFIGFLFTLSVAIYWSIYFIHYEFWWLAVYNISNIFFALRGLNNNQTKEP